MAEVSPASSSDHWRYPPQYYNQHSSANSCLSPCTYINHPSLFVPAHRAPDWGILYLAHTLLQATPQQAGKLCQRQWGRKTASCQGYKTLGSMSQPSPVAQIIQHNSGFFSFYNNDGALLITCSSAELCYKGVPQTTNLPVSPTLRTCLQCLFNMLASSKEVKIFIC